MALTLPRALSGAASEPSPFLEQSHLVRVRVRVRVGVRVRVRVRVRVT